MGNNSIKGVSVIISVSSFPIVIIKAPRNLTQDGQIIRIENASTIIASTYNGTDVLDVLQMKENDITQGTKLSKITQPQNSNNEIIDEYKSESQNITGQIDMKQNGKLHILQVNAECQIQPVV